ncbi:MAG: ribonuclease P protein component [Defluviitaleaceae bacterium]|nr:ribonuclease P protein component [Defluviitaleaceae bacterium]
MESIKKTCRFKKVYNHRRSVANRLLVLYIKKNGMENNFLGISISRKVGKAVVRNRIKRLIKEQIRLQEEALVRGYDLVIVVRAAAGDLQKDEDYKQIGRALLNLLDRQSLRKV